MADSSEQSCKNWLGFLQAWAGLGWATACSIYRQFKWQITQTPQTHSNSLWMPSYLQESSPHQLLASPTPWSLSPYPNHLWNLNPDPLKPRIFNICKASISSGEIWLQQANMVSLVEEKTLSQGTAEPWMGRISIARACILQFLYSGHYNSEYNELLVLHRYFVFP